MEGQICLLSCSPRTLPPPSLEAFTVGSWIWPLTEIFLYVHHRPIEIYVHTPFFVTQTVGELTRCPELPFLPCNNSTWRLFSICAYTGCLKSLEKHGGKYLIYLLCFFQVNDWSHGFKFRGLSLAKLVLKGASLRVSFGKVTHCIKTYTMCILYIQYTHCICPQGVPWVSPLQAPWGPDSFAEGALRSRVRMSNNSVPTALLKAGCRLLLWAHLRREL